MENKQSDINTSGENFAPIEKVRAEDHMMEVQGAPGFTDIDLAVSKKMRLKEPDYFSTDHNLVNDMVKFAREEGIKLPRFTSDPFKIASAIAASKEEEK